MFRAVPSSSSGGQIVLLQPLVSSLCKRPYSMPVESGLQDYNVTYEGWNFNSGNYLFTTDTK